MKEKKKIINELYLTMMAAAIILAFMTPVILSASFVEMLEPYNPVGKPVIIYIPPTPKK